MAAWAGAANAEMSSSRDDGKAVRAGNRAVYDMVHKRKRKVLGVEIP